MKKILFTDLDGTLLKDDKTVSENNRKAIERLLKAGHYLVITTGRPVKSGFEVAKQLGLTMPGCYMIAYNGAVIYDCAKECVVSEKTVSKEYVAYLFEEAKKYGIYIQTYNKDFLVAQRECPELHSYANKFHLDYQLCQDGVSVLEKEPNKVLLIDLDCEENLLKFQREHSDWQEGKCNSVFSSKQYLEYIPLHTDKGNAVVSLCELLNIPLSNAYAAGDERNDVPMIRAVGNGFAVQNALEATKAAADYVTDRDNEHDAIAEIIEGYMLGK